MTRLARADRAPAVRGGGRPRSLPHRGRGGGGARLDPATSRVHAGGKGGGGVNAVEKTIKIIAALQELERHWANAKSHPILPPGLRHALAGDHRRRAGRRQRRPPQPVLERRHDAELLLGRIQPLVLPGRVARGCARRGRGGRRRRVPRRSVAAGAPAAVHVEARAASTSRRSTCRSTIPRCARSPTASTASGSIRRRRGSAPRPISPGTASGPAGRSSAAPAASRSATSPTSTWRPSSSPSLPGLRAARRRLVRVAAGRPRHRLRPGPPCPCRRVLPVRAARSPRRVAIV